MYLQLFNCLSLQNYLFNFFFLYLKYKDDDLEEEEDEMSEEEEEETPEPAQKTVARKIKGPIKGNSGGKQGENPAECQQQ